MRIPALLSNFWVVGINYRKSDVSIRGSFALNNEQYDNVLELAPLYGIQELFVLSTCNRTEIYGLAENPNDLIQLLCTQTQGDAQTFSKFAYLKNAQEAVAHLYNVAAGIDSQILGDYEIVAQIKDAVKTSKKFDRLGQFNDRLFQSVLQASRDIRSKTNLSSGSVSVSYAAIQYLLNHTKDIASEKVLIIGCGKMGIASLKNLKTLSPDTQIYVANRTESKALDIAQKLDVNHVKFQDINAAIAEATTIIVATNATSPILTVDHFNGQDSKILIDLSIPNNIDPQVAQFKNIHLVNVDELSKMNDETLKMRAAEITPAKNIINFHIHQFAEWYMMQKNVPYLKSVKEKLQELNNNLRLRCPFDHDTKVNLQSTINTMAEKLKSDSTQPGCTYIETLSGYINTTVQTQNA